MNFPSSLIDRFGKTRVVAGFSVKKAEHGVPIAKALLAGGIDIIELTLRTPAAMDAVKAICEEVPNMLVGVGTILTPESAREVKAAGADFGVSPGLNANTVRAAQEAGLPFAPGIATPSELESAIELGCRFVKFFPAEAAGGISYLKSMATPYRHLEIQYFPLGGIHAQNMADYLELDCVPAIGGSWIVTKDLLDNEDWEGITNKAVEVRSLLP